MSDESSEAPRRSVAAGLLGAVLPLVALAIAGASLSPLLDGELADALLTAAPFGFGAMAAAGLAAVGLAVLLALAAGRGMRVPVAVLLGVAAAPWMLGFVGTLAGSVRVRAALAYADGEAAPRLASMGMAESLHAAVLGGWLSAALFSACGLGLAIGARARRGEGRRAWPALLAAPLALAAVALAFIYRDALAAPFLALPALLAALVALPLAASAVGRDARSGAQASAGAFAAVLGVLATLLTLRAASLAIGLAGAVSMEPASRALYLRTALVASTLGWDFALFALVPLSLAVLVVAGLAMARGRPVVLAVGGAAALLVALVTFGADRYVERVLRDDLDASMVRSLDGVDGFSPVRDGGGLPADFAPHAYVTREALFHGAGGRASLEESALVEAFTALRGVEAPPWGEESERVLDDLGPDAPLEDEEREGALVADGELGLAFDARVTPAVTIAVLRAAGRAGHPAVGLLSEYTPGDGVAVLARDPVIAGLARGPVLRERLYLEPALPVGGRRGAWHATVDGGEELTLRELGGTASIEVSYEDLEGTSPDLEGRLVYLQAGEGATPARWLAAARIVRERGGEALFLAGPLPAPPPVDAAVDGAQVDNAQVVAGRVRGSVHPGGLEEETGTGIFDPSIVNATLRRNMPEIQTCYERALATQPTLAGRVLVRFTIQPSGAITGTTATENETGSPAVALCLVSVINRVRFNPGPEGGSVTFAYPFVFAPQAQ